MPRSYLVPRLQQPLVFEPAVLKQFQILAPDFFALFENEKTGKPSAVRLNPPPSLKIHPTFHLCPFNPVWSPPTGHLVVLLLWEITSRVEFDFLWRFMYASSSSTNAKPRSTPLCQIWNSHSNICSVSTSSSGSNMQQMSKSNRTCNFLWLQAKLITGIFLLSVTVKVLDIHQVGIITNKMLWRHVCLNLSRSIHDRYRNHTFLWINCWRWLLLLALLPHKNTHKRTHTESVCSPRTVGFFYSH